MRLIFALLFAALAGQIHAASCQEFWDGTAGIGDLDQDLACLSWAIPTQNADGSDLHIDDISAYIIFYGKNSADLDLQTRVDVNTATGYELTLGCEVAMWHFEIETEKAVEVPNAAGDLTRRVSYSVRSAPVSKQFGCISEPNAPTEFRVQFRIT